MFCQKCGTQLGEGAAFCPNCGTRVNAENTIQQSVEPVDNAMKQENKDTVIQNDADNFKRFVDNHVRSKTKFSSAEDLITNAKPWKFAWICVGICALIGLILGINSGMVIPAILVFGGFFGYVATYIVGGIKRASCRADFCGEFEGEINTDEFLAFLNGHLRIVSPYFQECGYLSNRGGLLTAIDNAALRAAKQVMLCCTWGPKKKDLAVIGIRPDMREENSGKMQYFVRAEHRGFMIDGRASGMLAHGCLIRTTPIMEAALLYYLQTEANRNKETASE